MYTLFLTAYMCALWLMYKEWIKAAVQAQKRLKKIQRPAQELNRIIMKRRSLGAGQEFYKSSVILKNLITVTGGSALSADHIYEKLMENSDILKPVYGRMLSLYRSGKDEEAFRVPVDIIGTREARSFALILSKVDKIDPAELKAQTEIFQNSMTEKKVTAAMKQAQRNSAVITALSAGCVFALLINFTVVAVFMKSLDMMSSVFG